MTPTRSLGVTCSLHSRNATTEVTEVRRGHCFVVYRVLRCVPCPPWFRLHKTQPLGSRTYAEDTVLLFTVFSAVFRVLRGLGCTKRNHWGHGGTPRTLFRCLPCSRPCSVSSVVSVA